MYMHIHVYISALCTTLKTPDPDQTGSGCAACLYGFYRAKGCDPSIILDQPVSTPLTGIQKLEVLNTCAYIKINPLLYITPPVGWLCDKGLRESPSLETCS